MQVASVSSGHFMTSLEEITSHFPELKNQIHEYNHTLYLSNGDSASQPLLGPIHFYVTPKHGAAKESTSKRFSFSSISDELPSSERPDFGGSGNFSLAGKSPRSMSPRSVSPTIYKSGPYGNCLTKTGRQFVKWDENMKDAFNYAMTIVGHYAKPKDILPVMMQKLDSNYNFLTPRHLTPKLQNWRKEHPVDLAALRTGEFLNTDEEDSSSTSCTSSTRTTPVHWDEDYFN